MENKPSKQELQDMIDTIPAHSVPAQIVIPPRYPYGVPYREDGEYAEETISED